MKKKFLSLLLLLSLMLSLIPAAAAVDASPDGELNPKASAADLASAAAANDPRITSAEPCAQGVLLRWKPYTGAAKYAVFLRNASGKWKKIAVTAATSYLHRLTPKGKPYTYTVRAISAQGRYTGGYDKKGRTFTCLPAPQLQSVENSFASQKLTWSAVKGATHYIVYVKTDSAFKPIGVTDKTRFFHAGLTSGSTYTYTVRCYDPKTHTNVSFYDTKGISAVYLAAPRITGFTPADGGLRLQWEPIGGAVRYCVFVKKDGGWKKLGYPAGTSFLHTGLTDKIVYTYTVRCTDSKGNFTSACNPAGFGCRYLAPPAVKTLVRDGKNNVIGWSGSDDFAAYRVYRRRFGADWEYLGKTAATSFTDTKAEENALYTYALRGTDGDGVNLTCFRGDFGYWRNGAAVEGKLTTNGATFSFSAGKLTTGYCTVNGRRYYYNAHGIRQKNTIVGSDAEGYTYADKNGVCNTSQQVRQAAAFIAKHGKGTTLSQRAGSAIIYMRKNFPYRRSYNTPKKPSDLPALATDMFNRGSGNCYRYAAAFAYMAKIGGYRVRMTVGATAGSPHGWLHLLVNNRWIMCDNRIVRQPGYTFPDYTGYKKDLLKWDLVSHFVCELEFTENGGAVWK